ncbi:212_t:CDS:2 [Ambispora gerdemannii]|uniref:212_t:CDS:1 n=1 Tax=Ambispora gerdemannii TaxID=144530 RepID=A0A9N9BKU9_9GLOM|nr:212_t:CDS:2 [Ambispora gerdemannii]
MTWENKSGCLSHNHKANLLPFGISWEPCGTNQKIKLFAENKIVTINWPANSPDLNPIENIWKVLKDNVQIYEVFPKSEDELKIALKEEWEKLDVSVFEEIISSPITCNPI